MQTLADTAAIRNYIAFCEAGAARCRDAGDLSGAANYETRAKRAAVRLIEADALAAELAAIDERIRESWAALQRAANMGRDNDDPGTSYARVTLALEAVRKSENERRALTGKRAY